MSGRQHFYGHVFIAHPVAAHLGRIGREVRGIRVNEDSFTIQVRDSAGTLYSFRKTDVQNVDKQFGRSLMPGYKDKLSAAETDDLVAYLASLGARK